MLLHYPMRDVTDIGVVTVTWSTPVCDQVFMLKRIMETKSRSKGI